MEKPYVYILFTVSEIGFVQDFVMEIQGVFKDYSRINTATFTELQINIHIACMNAQEAQTTENETLFLAHHEFTCKTFFKTFLNISSNYFFDLFISVKEVNRKRSQISRSLINFKGKIPIFK